MLVKVKYANIINIAANKEIIPELLQSKCNSDNIFNTVDGFLKDKDAMKNQTNNIQKIISSFKTGRSCEIAKNIILKNL